MCKSGASARAFLQKAWLIPKNMILRSLKVKAGPIASGELTGM
jgi:hypothetical protein